MRDERPTNRATKIENGMRPVHPSEVLREDFLRAAGLTANALAKVRKIEREIMPMAV